MRVRVYNDYGTSQLSANFTLSRFEEFGITAVPIKAADIAGSHNWMDETDLLVFTSNSVTKFMEALGPSGMDAIQHYVRQRGGLYLGICAGAYFGAKTIDFSGEHLTRRTDGLGFFNVIARGGLNDIMGRPYSGYSNSAAIVDMFEHGSTAKFTSLYWGGPRFLVPQKDPNLSPLFWMLSKDRQESYLMAIHGPVGDQGGHAFLLGNHCEVSRDNALKYIAYLTSGKHYDAPLAEKLFAASEQSWQQGFSTMLAQVHAVHTSKLLRQSNLPFPLTP